MISLDQVLLLQEKVETAVQKISDLTEKNERLTSENDALRSKCAELSKALSEKTELVSSFENQQDRIEEGILNALKKLDGVENAVLENAAHTEQKASGVILKAEAINKAQANNNASQPVPPPVKEDAVQEDAVQEEEPFLTEESTEEAFTAESDITLPVPEDDSSSYPDTQVNGNFDIF